MSSSEDNSQAPANIDDAVGYRNPPKHTQFKKGQSGNRKGRPKGSLNFSSYIEKASNEKVTVTENGSAKRIPKKQIAAKQLVNKAASGDLKAIPILLNEQRHRETALATIPQSELVQQEDDKVIKNLLTRIRQCEDSSQSFNTEHSHGGLGETEVIPSKSP